MEIDATRPCKRCHGEGRTHSRFAVEQGWEGPEGAECRWCHGKGHFAKPDFKALVDVIFTTRGGKKTFRKSFPSKLDRYGSTDAARAYFIWRLARFHGGADVTMPITAEGFMLGDPYEKELDEAAGIIARKVFGTDLAATSRWGRLLGFATESPKGLPPSAYESGPVADENKPEWELSELQ